MCIYIYISQWRAVFTSSFDRADPTVKLYYQHTYDYAKNTFETYIIKYNITNTTTIS